MLPSRFLPGSIWPPLGFALLCGVYYSWGWSRILGDFGGDNAFYLLIAQYFSPWSAPSDVAAYFFAHSVYPPLYPLVLALFGGGESLLIAHLVTVSCLLLAFATQYVWLRTLGVSILVACLSVMLFALIPGTYMSALSVHSESLYLLSSLLALTAITFAEKTDRHIWYWIAAFSIAAATLTRGAGISLVAAFVIYLMLYRPARSVLYASASALPMLLWNLFRDKQADGYFGILAERYSGASLDTLLSHIGAGLHALWYGWAGNFATSPVGFAVTGAIGLVCLAGMIYRIYLCKVDALYAAAYLFLILIWPFPAEAQRFMLVIIPVFLAQGLLLVDVLSRGWRVHRLPDFQSVMIFFIFLVVLPALVLNAGRFMKRPPGDLAEFRHSPAWYTLDSREALSKVAITSAMTNHLRQINDMLPPGSCIYSIKPSIVGYYANRVSLIPPREHLDDTAFANYLKEKNCRYFYLMVASSSSFSKPYYPADRLQDSLKVLHAVAFPDNASMPVGVLAELADQQ